MPAQTTTFTYTPLDESNRQIRLLHLHPSAQFLKESHEGGNGTTGSSERGEEANPAQPDIAYEEEIHCTLNIAALDDNLEYEVLSYVWGDATDTVTRSLFDAIFYIRQATERVLWVHALCINQMDLEEQAEQVLHMQHIYADASRVIVYLGSWKEAAIAFQHIRQARNE